MQCFHAMSAASNLSLLHLEVEYVDNLSYHQDEKWKVVAREIKERYQEGIQRTAEACRCLSDKKHTERPGFPRKQSES